MGFAMPADELHAAKRARRQKRLMPWLFVAPCLIVILLVTIFPTIYSIGLSLYKWELTLPTKPFIGLENYAQLLQDSRFLHASMITAFIVVVGVTLELVLGFAFAQTLVAEMKGKRFIVALMLLPVMVMPVSLVTPGAYCGTRNLGQSIKSLAGLSAGRFTIPG